MQRNPGRYSVPCLEYKETADCVFADETTQPADKARELTQSAREEGKKGKQMRDIPFLAVMSWSNVADLLGCCCYIKPCIDQDDQVLYVTHHIGCWMSYPWTASP